MLLYDHVKKEGEIIMKVLRLLLIVTVISIFSTLQISSAFAYVLMDSGWWGYDVYWSKDFYYYYSYHDNIIDAQNSWNNTPTKANIWYEAGTWCDISTQSLPNETWYGLYHRGIGYYTVTLNDYTLSRDFNDGTINFEHAKQSTMAHEWGHALGLDDVPSGTTMLMGWARDRTRIYTPQQDDINGVIAKWGNP